MKNKCLILEKLFGVNFFLELSLFLFVVFIFILPSILVDRHLIFPLRPETVYEIFLFLFKILVLAMFEELIYRVYLPYQIKRFSLKRDYLFKKKENEVFISNILFALAHSYLGTLNVCFAFIAGSFFSFVYKKLKKNLYIAFFMISLIHFFYNTIAFYVLYFI